MDKDILGDILTSKGIEVPPPPVVPLTQMFPGYGKLYISLQTGVRDCKNNQHNEGQNIGTFQCEGPSVVTVNPITKFDSSCK